VLDNVSKERSFIPSSLEALFNTIVPSLPAARFEYEFKNAPNKGKTVSDDDERKVLKASSLLLDNSDLIVVNAADVSLDVKLAVLATADKAVSAT
jgi:hypothetical protein